MKLDDLGADLRYENAAKTVLEDKGHKLVLYITKT